MKTYIIYFIDLTIKGSSEVEVQAPTLHQAMDTFIEIYCPVHSILAIIEKAEVLK